jgi:hypothetical protein
MSTGAMLWLLVLGVLLVGAVSLVVGSVVSLYRRSRRLAGELHGLRQDVDRALGSARPGLGNGSGLGHDDGLPG